MIPQALLVVERAAGVYCKRVAQGISADDHIGTLCNSWNGLVDKEDSSKSALHRRLHLSKNLAGSTETDCGLLKGLAGTTKAIQLD